VPEHFLQYVAGKDAHAFFLSPQAKS
jgi:hypothetical protein